MNDAHLHLVVNHFPIIGSILGLGVLLAGLFLKNISVKNTAYGLFIVAAIFAIFSMATGEGAEELVEDIPGIGHEIIHEHEELAEKFALVLYALGLVSILGIYTNLKNHSKAKLISYIAIIVAIIGVFLSTKVGTSGGEIRHTEIRNDAVSTHSNSESPLSKEDND